VLGERASYTDIRVWQDEKRENDKAKMRAVLSTLESPEARRGIQAQIDALSDE